jgi:hypothetical protein
MMLGAHVLLSSDDPEADRRFFKEVLGFTGVDAGGGWLIFRLPPAELAVHPREAGAPPASGELPASLYLMCEDLGAAMRRLAERQVRCGEVAEAPWGTRTTIALPSGGTLGLYQPRHPTALGLPPAS